MVSSTNSTYQKSYIGLLPLSLKNNHQICNLTIATNYKLIFILLYLMLIFILLYMYAMRTHLFDITAVLQWVIHILA